ncbi:hypothetical protein, partial [Escherichia coli]|uniref:hypothetical protein n=1 Tax=Escherichia coli TaxID=562 RepID=UPI001F29E44D
ILAFDNHTNGPLTDLRGKARIFSHPVYLSLKEFSLQDSRGDSGRNSECSGGINHAGGLYGL